MLWFCICGGKSLTFVSYNFKPYQPSQMDSQATGNSSPIPRTLNPYKPLASSDDIRLLYLQPRNTLAPNPNSTFRSKVGSASRSVVCDIQHSTLSSNPQYEALSYMWGSDQSDYPITLNGQPFYVRSNLQAALENLQLSHQTRVLWVKFLLIC